MEQEKIFKDCIGLPLKIGDSVIYTKVDTSSVYYGEVIGFTPKKVKIKNYWGQNVNKDPDNLALCVGNKEKYPEYFL